MTVEDFLRGGTQKLVRAGVGTARLDVLVLLEDCLKLGRAQLLAHPEMVLGDEQLALLDGHLARRAEHEPLAYVRGKVEFYGREFLVTPNVLVPRPESETMIELLKALVGRSDILSRLAAKNGLESLKNGRDSSPQPATAGMETGFTAAGLAKKAANFDKNQKNNKISDFKSLTSKVFSNLTIGDIGTGSGALGITAALELPGSQVELLEIDPAALFVTKQNAAKHGLKTPVTKSDLLANATLDLEVLLCNLPYVPDDFGINQAATREPRLAIFGGADGLDIYRQLFEQIKSRASQPELILTESLPPQHVELAKIAADFGYSQVAEDDFIQAFKLGA